MSDEEGKSGPEVDDGFFREGSDAEGVGADGTAADKWARPVYEGPPKRRGRTVVLMVGTVLAGVTAFAVWRSQMKSKAAALANAPIANAQVEVNCRSAHARHLFQEVVFTCPRALQVKPQAADIAVMLAEAELERGRTAESIGWAQKAIAVDPKAADAYVFLGGSHQKEGRSNEARAAYQKYLELAPTGRHAKHVKQMLAQPQGP